MITMGEDGTDLVAALNQKFGEGHEVLADAKEAIDAMPEHSKAWIQELLK
jgi:hypothetical protein